MKMYANDYLLPEKQNLSFIGPKKQNFFWHVCSQSHVTNYNTIVAIFLVFRS